jgi:cation transport regulator ChaC
MGFIQGRNALVTENSTNQSKALRLLQALYDATRNQTEPAIVHMLNTGLSEPESQAAWRYLKDRGLIETFSIPYTARINAAGIDAIEGAKRRPDQPSANFPSVSYNIVYNTMHVGTMHNSPIQQGGVNSTQTQTITYSPQDLGDLYRLISELTSHLNELSLDERQLQKAQAQIATIKAQLSDEPDPVILKQAGRTLRNVIEGAVGSLLATAVSQPTIWTWVHEAMQRLFG